MNRSSWLIGSAMLAVFSLAMFGAANDAARAGGEKKVIPPIKGSKGGDNKIPPIKGGKAGGGLIVPFMGLKARGRNFVIIADRSGSMAAGKKYWDYTQNKFLYGKASIEYLKEELLKSINALQNKGQIYIILYDTNIEKQPILGYARSTSEIKKLKEWVSGIKAKGQTVPAPAFNVTFALSQAPDAIFFMSDGIIDNPKGLYQYVGRLWGKLPEKKRPKIFTVQMEVPGRDKANVLYSRWYKKRMPPNIMGILNRERANYQRNLLNPVFRQKEAAKRNTQIALMKQLAKVTKGEFKLIVGNPGSASVKSASGFGQ